jgi:hypothetical protein
MIDNKKQYRIINKVAVANKHYSRHNKVMFLQWLLSI